MRRNAGVIGAFLAVIAAFAAIYVQHQDQRELIRVQVAIEMVKLYDSTEMRRARRTFAAELLGQQGKSQIAEARVLDFFETLALYYRQDRIDDDSVYTNFEYPIMHYWAAARDHIMALRKTDNDAEFYGGFEDLSGIMARQNASQHRPPPTRVKQFLQEEAALPE